MALQPQTCTPRPQNPHRAGEQGPGRRGRREDRPQPTVRDHQQRHRCPQRGRADPSETTGRVERLRHQHSHNRHARTGSDRRLPRPMEHRTIIPDVQTRPQSQANLPPPSRSDRSPPHHRVHRSRHRPPAPNHHRHQHQTTDSNPTTPTPSHHPNRRSNHHRPTPHNPRHHNNNRENPGSLNCDNSGRRSNNHQLETSPPTAGPGLPGTNQPPPVTQTTYTNNLTSSGPDWQIGFGGVSGGYTVTAGSAGISPCGSRRETHLKRRTLTDKARKIRCRIGSSRFRV